MTLKPLTFCFFHHSTVNRNAFQLLTLFCKVDQNQQHEGANIMRSLLTLKFGVNTVETEDKVNVRWNIHLACQQTMSALRSKLDRNPVIILRNDWLINSWLMVQVRRIGRGHTWTHWTANCYLGGVWFWLIYFHHHSELTNFFLQAKWCTKIHFWKHLKIEIGKALTESWFSISTVQFKSWI